MEQGGRHARRPYWALVRGQAIPEYLAKVHQLGVHAIVNVENVEGVANGKAAILTGSFTATLTNAPEVRGTLVQLYENEGASWKLRASIGSRFASPPPSPGLFLISGFRLIDEP
jgi:hypothetical protein